MPESLKELEEQQFARQKKAERRAKEARDSQQRRLREMGKESSLDYGQRLFSLTIDAVADDLGRQFEEFLLDPKKARRHAAALPHFDPFDGTHHIAAVALTAAIDQLSRRQRLPTFLQHLGRSIERELRLIKLGKKYPMEMRRLLHTGMSRRELSNKRILQALRVPVVEWDDQTRLQVGIFLADSIFATELMTTIQIQKGIRRPRLVVPTAQAEQFIKETRPKHYNPQHLAMLIPPRDWPGLYGGGILDNDYPLVKAPVQDAGEEWALAHYEAADMSVPLKVVNFLQAQRLRCSGEMVAAQRITWEAGWTGLWPCSRNPPEMPDRLGGDPSPEELKARNRRAAECHRDRETNRHRRLRIERSLQISEESADRVLYQSWYYCHRGRIYANAAVSTQGTGYERAQMSFAEPLPVDDEAFDWMLKCAAGEWGMSRCTWKERLNWGRSHLDQMLAAAEDPLNTTELWRGAAHPWEFLQLCHGLREARATGKTGVGLKFDQTTSGCGILSALTREESVARLCNVFGDTPSDLYTRIAEATTEELTKDLHCGDPRKRAMAELWLQRGIDRSLVKGPVLRAPMGGSYMTLCDDLVAALEDHIGFVDLDQYLWRISIPSKYLASILWSEMRSVIDPVMGVKAWIRACCRALLTRGKPMEWTSPMGWPMRIADREPTKRKIETGLFGRKTAVTIEDQPIDSPLSPTQACKALAANMLHQYDAALCQRIVYLCAEQSIPIAPTHDCFMCHPANAAWLHRTLLHEFGQMFRKRLLEDLHLELVDRSGVKLPPPPVINSLDPMAIGSNPYLFS